jgi:cbb3-type cytochrome oxidase subunit 3
LNTLIIIQITKSNYASALGALLFLFCFSAKAQVNTQADTTSIKIGEELRIQFEIEADSIDLVVFPDQQTFLPLEVIESYETDTTYANSKIKYRKQYGLTQFDSGKYTIPRQKIIFNNTFYLSDSIQVEVRDVAVDTTKQKMFDIKPVVGIEKPSFEITKLLYWLLPLLLVAVAIWYFLRRKKKKAEAEKQLPPYEEALVALKELDKSEYLLQNKSKEYYSLLTEIVKRYLDREVDNAALESTTDELIERLQGLKKSGNFDFEIGDIKKLNIILKRADLVKFAKMQQGSGQAETDRTAVEEIINHTHEAIPEPTEEELLQDAMYQEALQKKKLRRKIVLAGSSIVLLLIIGAAVFSSLYGFGVLKETVFGNSLKDSLEGRWYKSEYGAPGLIINTPEILVRQEVAGPTDTITAAIESSVFQYGAIGDALHVSLSVTNVKEGENQEEQEINLDAAIEKALEILESSGALNMVVKRESFSSEEGLKGLKAFGDFNLKLPKGKISEDKMAYEMLLFDQENAVQMVTVVFERDAEYANQIKERIINSIEVPVTKQDPNKKEPKNAQ